MASATSSATSSRSHAQQRLNALADTFNAYYADLDDETAERRNADEKRLVRIEKEILKVEKSIHHEAKRRVDAGKSIQRVVEEQLEEMQLRFKRELHDAYSPLQAQIDALVERVESCEAAIALERNSRDAEIEKANTEVRATFEEHSKQFEIEKLARMQREAITLKRVGDEVFRMEQKVNAERLAREAAIVLMKDDFYAALRARVKSDEAFKADVAHKMSIVERDLEGETRQRLATEERLSKSVSEYAVSMRAGIEAVHGRAKSESITSGDHT